MRPRRVAQVLAGAIVCVICLNWLESPLRPSALRRVQMLAIAPQWWGYFAHPLEDRVQAFRRQGDTWIQVDAPFGSPGNLFGARRGPVHHSSEMRALQAQVEGHWSEAPLAPDAFPQATAPLAVRNAARHPRLCGDVLLLERTPIPWAWARSRNQPELPARYARLEIQC